MARSWNGVFVLFSSVSAAVMSFAACPASEPFYESPDQVAVELTPEQTLKRARAFLAEHPRAPAAARAAMDQLLAATSLREDDLIDRARATLLLDYPGTLQANYVAESFKKDEEFCELMVREFTDPSRKLDTTFLSRFWAAGYRAPNSVKATFGKNSQYVIAFAYAHHLVTAAEGVDPADWKGRAGDSALPIIQELQSKQSVDRLFLALSKWPDHKAAQAIQRSLFDRIPSRERSADIIADQLENLIFVGLTADAAELSSATPAHRQNARSRFWGAIGLAGIEKFEEAVELLDGVTGAEDDKWVPGTAELKGHIAAIPKALSYLPAVAKPMFDDLRTSVPTAIECLLIGDALGDSKSRVYLAYDSKAAHFELTYWRGDTMRFGYRCEGPQGTFYLPDSLAIQQFTEGRCLPDFRWRIRQAADGQSKLTFNVNFSSEIRDNLADFIQPLTSERLKTSEEDLRRWLVESIAYRMIATPPETVDGKTQFHILGFERGTPKLYRTTIRLTADGKLDGIDVPSFTTKRLKYGASGEIAFDPPKWPELPVRKSDSMKPSEMFELMTAGVKVLEELMPKDGGATN